MASVPLAAVCARTARMLALATGEWSRKDPMLLRRLRVCLALAASDVACVDDSHARAA